MAGKFGWHSGTCKAAKLNLVGNNEISGAGAISLDTSITWLVTTAGAAAVTLADGEEGQVKILIMKTDGTGDATVTPTNLGNGATITFDDAGDCAMLVFTNSNWYMFGGTATLA